jgi:hypothetical protein
LKGSLYGLNNAVGLVSRCQSNPGKEHWQVVKRIFRYLQGTKNIMLCFNLSDLNIARYTNANFAGDVDDRKSTKWLYNAQDIKI